MKKLLALLLVAVMVFSLVACAQREDNDNGTTPPTEENTDPTNGGDPTDPPKQEDPTDPPKQEDPTDPPQPTPTDPPQPTPTDPPQPTPTDPPQPTPTDPPQPTPTDPPQPTPTDPPQPTPTDPPQPEPTDPPVDPETLKYGGHLNIASININGRLDPCNVGGVYHWPNLIWESPLSRNADGSIAPGVCNFELSEDQLTLKLWVREGIKFHDGTDVEIEDVVASMLRRGHKSPTTYVVNYIEEGYPTVENGVATFKFKKYSEKTMYYIASVKTLHAVLPKEFVEMFPGTTPEGNVQNTEVRYAIGTGPYMVDSERDGEWLKLKRFDGYVKSDASLTGGAGPKNAYFDTITFWAQGEATAIQLLAHDIDVWNSTMDEYKDRFELESLAQTQQMGTKTYYLLFNNMNQENQVHADVNLRKAICAAIDFEELNAEMWASNYDLTGTPAQDAAYYVDTWEKADYMGKANVELAQKYLKESNYKGEAIYFLGTDSNLASLLEDYLEAAGMKMQIDIKDGTQVDQVLTDGAAMWNFTFWPFTAGNSPSTVAANAYTRAWVSEDKDDVYDVLTTTIPGSKEYMDAWKEMAQIWVDECVTVYVGQQYATWTHHKDLVVDYKNADIYIWNWYWKNPAEHAE